MFKLIKGAYIYAPGFIGKKDMLVAFGRIAEIGDELQYNCLNGCEVVDAEGLLLLPGFVDSHVHITGGGGEAGFSSRIIEASAKDLLSHGITTVVGLLGTDGLTRSLENLYAKAKALEEEGMTAYIYTGSYQVPVLTLTGNVQRDIVLIDKVIGAGEIAISDHRSSQPTFEELARLASEVRLGGMLSGKKGLLHFHLGDYDTGLLPLFELLERTPFPVSQFLPAHLNRNTMLFEQGIELLKRGGCIDLTAGFEDETGINGCIPSYSALEKLYAAGDFEDRVIISSDSNGSLPVFDDEGRLVAYEAASSSVLLEDVRSAVFEAGLPLEKVLKAVATNPADTIGASRKGRLAPGYDADFVLAGEKLDIKAVYAGGKRLYHC